MTGQRDSYSLCVDPKNTHRSSDPFTSVDSSVPDDGGLSGTRGAIQMDARDLTTLERLADAEERRVAGEGSL